MIPLFSVQQVREADNYAINTLGLPGAILMENASASIFNIAENYIKELYKSGPIGFVCGKGNNGGDGFAVARHFINKGYKVVVIHIADESEMTGDALLNFKILKASVKEIKGSILKKYNSPRDIGHLNECILVFDALLGTGAKGELNEPYRSIISDLNNLNLKRLAVDIPTGLDADTGSGDIIFKADLTVTLAELKRGLYVNRGAASCGRVFKGYIGVPEAFFDRFEVDEYIIEPEDALAGIPYKAEDIYKYSAGKVLVLAGSAEFPGASVMTSVSVLKSGAGACFLCFPFSDKAIVQSKLNEVIVQSYEDENSGILRKKNISELQKKFDWMDVLAIGPGLGRDQETIEAVKEIIDQNAHKKIVIDADAVFALGEKGYKELELSNCVFTPHYVEFAHLLGIKLTELQKNIFSYGKTFAEETGAYLVLKGAPTVIFNPMGEAFVNSTGNPGMAKFGTGDVLTGIIAGFASQTIGIEEALISAVYLHSLSADLLLKEKTEFSIMATDIIDNLPNAIKFLRKSCV